MTEQYVCDKRDHGPKWEMPGKGIVIVNSDKTVRAKEGEKGEGEGGRIKAR